MSFDNVQRLVNSIAEYWFGGLNAQLAVKENRRQPARYIRIDSLQEAYRQYQWPFSIDTEGTPVSVGSSFNESKKVFEYCQNLLLPDGALTHEEDNIILASKIVLKWGGVYGNNSQYLTPGRSPSLRSTYSTIINTWDGIRRKNTAFNPAHPVDFPSNAGFTKIYSLLLQDYVMYDSRVAASLGALIERQFGVYVPDELRLFIPQGRQANAEMRRLNVAFRPTYQKPERHFYSNVIASLLLHEVLNRIQEENPDVTLRALEAALFMTGYDIRTLRMHANP